LVARFTRAWSFQTIPADTLTRFSAVFTGASESAIHGKTLHGRKKSGNVL
jgi:hypothetical protein